MTLNKYSTQRALIECLEKSESAKTGRQEKSRSDSSARDVVDLLRRLERIREVVVVDEQTKLANGRCDIYTEVMNAFDNLTITDNVTTLRRHSCYMLVFLSNYI